MTRANAGRRPSIVRITDNPKEMARLLQTHLARLYTESADHRSLSYGIGALGHGQTYSIGGTVPSRNRRWIGLQVAFNCIFDTGGGAGATARMAITADLYVGGTASTDKALTATAGGTASTGRKQALSTAIVNEGKQWNDTTHFWKLVVTGAGGAGNACEDVTVEIVYEDYTPYQNRSVNV